MHATSTHAERASQAPAIQVEGLRYWYPPVEAGQAPTLALDGLTLTITPGEAVGVTGPAGSGKSTFCLALTGLVPQETGGVIEGRVLVAGYDTRRVSVAALAAAVSIVLQDPESNLLGLTVEDEVAFGPENMGVPPAEIARRVDWALTVMGLAHVRTRPSWALSGGQKQRLAIAAALSMQPSVLVLDEPTAQLDPGGRRELLRALMQLRKVLGQRLTLIVAERNLDWLSALVDRIIVLDHGQCVLDGPSPALLVSARAHMQALGLPVPQLAELAAWFAERTGITVAWRTVDEAQEALASWLAM